MSLRLSQIIENRKFLTARDISSRPNNSDYEDRFVDNQVYGKIAIFEKGASARSNRPISESLSLGKDNDPVSTKSIGLYSADQISEYFGIRVKESR